MAPRLRAPLASLLALALLTIFFSVRGFSRIRAPVAAVRAGARRAAAPRAPFRAVVPNFQLQNGTEKGTLYHPYFEFVLFPPDGAYPALIVADAFLQCAAPRRVVLMGRHYKRRPDMNHNDVVVHVVDNSTGARERLSGTWYETFNYESVAIGSFPFDGGAACATPGARVRVEVTYGPNAAAFDLAASPQPPPSQWAMVAIFSFSRHLLRMWMTYWHVIGVDTFYLFYNGASADIPTIQAELADMPVSLVIVDWQVLHWIQTDGADITHGQPIAINEAVQRWRHLHSFMAFYDTDEFLVLPNARNLDDFAAKFSAAYGPIVAIRSQCAWMYLNLTGSNLTSVADATVPDFLRFPVERGPAGGREKYFRAFPRGCVGRRPHVRVHLLPPSHSTPARPRARAMRQ